MIQKYKTTSTITPQLNSILAGINNAADVVISTMGGSGKNVIIADQNDTVAFTKDGVSVAKAMRLEDPNENIGAQLLINAANQTVNQCGDGTTLTSLFTKNFANSFFNYITKENPDINRTIDDAKEAINTVCSELKKRSNKIESIDDLYNIALTSSKSTKVATFIKEIYKKTGFDANISLEKSRVFDHTYYELTEGLSFESGMVHSSFANRENGTCVFENAVILIENKNISDYEQFIQLFKDCMREDLPLVIIAPTFSDTFIRYCLTNKNQAGLQICLVKMPGYGKGVLHNIQDIKSFISEKSTTNRFEANSFVFTLYNQTDKNKIKARVSQLNKLAENAVEAYDEQDFRNRIHRLNETSAIIYVGGVTEKNRDEEYDRIEDTVGAIKSALKEGYVRGAGVELIHIANELLLKNNESSKIVKEVLKTPYNQILINSNYNPGVVYSTPYNTKTGKQDPTIIDSTYILINALNNSFALVELLINTSYVIFNKESR